MRRHLSVCINFLAGASLAFGALHAQCGALGGFGGYPLENGTTIRLINSAPSVFSTQDLNNARDKWTTCPGLGTQFPGIEVGTGSGRPVYIQYTPGPNPDPNGRCEEVVTHVAGHTLLDATITIFSQQGNGTSCFPLAEDIGHAIGHIFGLDDAMSGSCAGTIMGARQAGASRLPAKAGDECQTADGGWEMLNPEPPPGGGGGGGGGHECSDPVAVESTVLPLSGEFPAHVLPDKRLVFSHRVEVVDDFAYVMEDWAVVTLGAAAPGKPAALHFERSSSAILAFSSAGAPGNTRRLSVEDSAVVGLLIEAPVHLHNSRYIRSPEVELDPTAVPYLGERVSVALRIDVGENREIRGTEVLYASDAVPAGLDLAAAVAEHLRLRYASLQRHRIIVFAVVDLVPGSLELRDSRVVLPRCCCFPICY